MKTTLSPEELAKILAEGRALADAGGRFVNPDTVYASIKVIRERGEEWAASVLMRELTRRSLSRPDLPWLEHGEMEALILANEAEWQRLEKELSSDQ